MNDYNSEKLKQIAETSEILCLSSFIFSCVTAGSTSSDVVRWGELNAVDSCTSPDGDSAVLLPTGDMLAFSLSISAFSWLIFFLQAWKKNVCFAEHSRVTSNSSLLCVDRADGRRLKEQGVTLRGCNTTGPPRAAPWWVTVRREVLQTPTDDDDRWRQTHGEQNNTGAPTLCVGGPVIIYTLNITDNDCVTLLTSIHATLLRWRVVAGGSETAAQRNVVVCLKLFVSLKTVALSQRVSYSNKYVRLRERAYIHTCRS